MISIKCYPIVLTDGGCPLVIEGADDLPTFDLIRRFQLDDIDLDFPGVKRVRGSNKIQTAYRLSKKADLTLPTRCS